MKSDKKRKGRELKKGGEGRAKRNVRREKRREGEPKQGGG